MNPLPPRCLLLAAALVWPSLSGCASADTSARNDYGNASFNPMSHRIEEHAEAMIRANPDMAKSEAYEITRRRFAGTDQRNRNNAVDPEANDDFNEDFKRVMGNP